jgi:hypothetical protein
MSALRSSPSGPLVRLTGETPVERTLSSSVGVANVNIGAPIPVVRGSYLASALVPLVGTAAGTIQLTFTPTVGAPVVVIAKAYSVGSTQTWEPVLSRALDIATAGSLQWSINNASGTANVGVPSPANALVQAVTLET